ncbi:MAG: hypothetical protein ACPIOQ_56245, partial [Promethearchaeia archaeon]
MPAHRANRHITLWRNSHAGGDTAGPGDNACASNLHDKHWRLINTCNDSSIQTKKLLKPSPTSVRLGKR